MSDALLEESLVYNIGSNVNQVEALNKQLQPPNFLPTTFPSVAQERLNNILTSFNIKRGCCLQVEDPNNSDNFTVPILTKSNSKFPNTKLGKIYNKIGKYHNPISFPKSFCKKIDAAYSNNSSVSCQNLYAVYCNKSMDDFKKVMGNLNDFDAFSPECGCYLPMPDNIKAAGINVPAICYSPSCERRSGIMLDPVSANPKTACNLTICTSNIKMSNIQAGRDAAINNKINQLCGSVGANINNDSTLTYVPNLITSLIDKTALERINNYVKNGTTYLSYLLLLTGSLVIIFIILAIIVLIIKFA